MASIDIEVECSCGGDLKVKGVSNLRTRQSLIINVEPCEVCIKSAIDKAVRDAYQTEMEDTRR